MSRRNSTSDNGLDDFVPDGGLRMSNLFDSVTGSTAGNRGADDTIRASTSGPWPPIVPPTTGPAINQPRNVPPHINQVQPAGTNNQAIAGLGGDLNRAQQDFLAAKLQLEQAKLVSQTAKLINDRWTDDKRLAANGNNMAQWLHELQEVGNGHMSSGDFFFKPIDNVIFEKIARMVVLEGVHQLLVSDLQQMKTAIEMLSYLKKKFSVVSRAAQYNVWNKFLNFSVDDLDGVGMSSTMRNLYTEWNNLNVRIHSDAFFGFIFQRAVMRSSVPFKKDFEQRMENAMQNDESKSVPKFDALVNTFDICKKQHTDSTASEASLKTAAAPSVLLAANGDGDFDFEAFLADVPEENWPDALDFYAATAHRCWQCGAADHYLRDCPQRAKPNQINKRLRGPGVSPFPMPANRTQATFVGSLYTQPNQQTANGPPVSRALPPMSQHQVQAKRLADLYRPRYASSNNRQQHPPNSNAHSANSAGGGRGIGSAPGNWGRPRRSGSD
ncbi:hypothetical protein PTTG_28489 [Puccinia triticina 1-1 BBBD Race 1]|uniref:CCHC-type domain-containing protein n=1 Tax=Puccinia triticina (isolate 1-1 / race 1 (BBBD)) TaxID=630390 RepID=A0A180GBA6_PUCT1|nr:hypothetical protein PTTG_28489 [Puccinia triticina 1-1 BBBD Race 1]